MMRQLLTFLLLLPVNRTHGWLTDLRLRQPVALSMIFGQNAQSAKAALPRDVKNAVQLCRQATQEALQKKTSRMDIEFPVGTKFGVEKKAGANRRKSADVDGTPTQQDLDQSDRELARLFVDMFQPVGGDNIAVVFNTANDAETATKRWKGDSTAQCRVLSVDRKKAAKKKKKQSRGFAAKMDAEIGDSDASGAFQLPANTEVALFVAPGGKERIAIERVCSQVGLGTLVILLNARLSTVEKYASDDAKRLFEEEFEPVFHLTAADQLAAPNCLLFRAFPGDWVLARKPRVGQPKSILVQKDRPTAEESRKCYDALDLSEVEMGVESALESVAKWFN